MSGGPLISVVMPAFNASAFIAEAIRSILAQEHRPLEIIVVDDGSTDDTAASVAAFGDVVRLYQQANAGPPAARNHGLSQACGELVTFLDADDVFEPDKLARQIPRLRANPEIDIVVGALRHFDLAMGELRSSQIEPLAQGDQLSLQLSCGLFRRSVFDRVGMFDIALRQCDDWDWFMRARELGVGMLMHREVVVNHRLHHHNITRNLSTGMTYQAMMFKRALDRRRTRNDKTPLPPLSSFYEPVSFSGPVSNGDNNA